MNDYEKELLFYLKDILEQINQFPEFRAGINTLYAERAIKKASEVKP